MTHHEQATRTTILKSLCRRGASPRRLKAITPEQKGTIKHSRSNLDCMARLVLICDGDDLVAHKLGNITTIGRAPLNHIVIDNPAVLAQHAIIGRSGSSYRLQDLHSTNGTQVNGVPITEVELKDSDKIRFGFVVAVFAEGRREG
jgi:FHA domain-containing protein